jgi:uncharacterized damage-inducible protein DinB
MTDERAASEPPVPPALPALGIPLLFDYLYWLRDRVLRTAEGLTDDEFRTTPIVGTRDFRGTLVHELDVEIGWRARLRGEPPEAWGSEAELKPADFETLAGLRERWRADEASMRAWLRELTERDLRETVTANGLEGYRLEIYLLHAVEHGVTEVSTAAAILGALGRSTGDLGILDALDLLAPLPRPGHPGSTS